MVAAGSATVISALPAQYRGRVTIIANIEGG